MDTEQNYIRVVIGLDFGTSFSGYAYAFKNDQEVICRTDWPGQPMPYIKTLTQLLYSPEQQVEAWGYEAPTRLAQLREDEHIKAYSLLKNFKMHLRDVPEQASGQPVFSADSGQQFAVLSVITDYLKCLRKTVWEDLQGATSGFLKETELLWCLTIPAIWTDSEKGLMRQAAQKAGLINDSAKDADRLLLVLEPEAAALACHAKDNLLLRPETSFMIVDCGGGTVDITLRFTKG